MKTNVKKAAVDGFCDGFMWGGLGFGFTRAVGAITSKTHIFKRPLKYSENYFMFGDNDLTIWRHGKDFRIDMGAEHGLHYHLRGAPGGISGHQTDLVRGIYYCLIGIKNAINAIFP